jgi:hypothetical protein
MACQYLTGGAADIKAPKTPTSERSAQEQRLDNERKRRPKNPGRGAGSAKCVLLYDPTDDLNFVLDYDIDKTFRQNLEDQFQPGVPEDGNESY